MRVSFIGGGVMAEAMLSRALAAGLCNPGDITVAEPIDARRNELASRYNINVSPNNPNAAAAGGLLVLAVKPQHIHHACRDLHNALHAEQPVMSIAAGVPIAAISLALAHNPIIRAMPNAPAQIGAGVSVWTATPQVNDNHQRDAAALLQTLGLQWRVDTEDYIDMATAISGSGPAYVFTFIEALAEAAVHIGIPRDMALTLALETTAGAAKLARESNQNPAILRQMVTSPAGTTAAALRELEHGRLRSTIIDAATAALRRARELGNNQ